VCVIVVVVVVVVVTVGCRCCCWTVFRWNTRTKMRPRPRVDGNGSDGWPPLQSDGVDGGVGAVQVLVQSVSRFGLTYLVGGTHSHSVIIIDHIISYHSRFNGWNEQSAQVRSQCLLGVSCKRHNIIKHNYNI